MLSKAFKVIEPKRFDLYIEDLILSENEVLVKVEYASICKADLRYYEGKRDSKILSLKYPMSLIHEATGIIVKDSSNTFSEGTRVVLIPNEVSVLCDKDCVCHDSFLGENYCPNALFASSNTDGFSKEFVKLSTKQVIRIDELVPSNIAVFSEMISVACAAIRRKKDISGVIGIWGDGVLGYILAATIKSMYPNNRLVVVGKYRNKLEQFPVDKIYQINDNIDEKFDIAFECVGGNKSGDAINQAIDHLKVGGTLILTGVAEEWVPINTRKILEKGITITGTTRSQRADFETAQELFKEYKFYKSIENLQLSLNVVENISDYYKIFELESNNKLLGKHILKFNL